MTGKTPPSGKRKRPATAIEPYPSRFLANTHSHHLAAELAELRKLAEIDPDLALKAIEQREQESVRITESYRLGLIMSISMQLVTITGLVLTMAYGTVLQAAAVISGVLAAALLARVVLTGNWSETSWFGRLGTFLGHAIGGKTKGGA